MNHRSAASLAMLALLGSCTSKDDEPTPGVISFTDSCFVIGEGAAKAYLPVARFEGITGEVSVDFSTESIQAIHPSDFDPRSGMLTWNDGHAGTLVIEIPIENDGEQESDESLEINLTSVDGSQIAFPTVRLKIMDDDGESHGVVPLSEDCTIAGTYVSLSASTHTNFETTALNPGPKPSFGFGRSPASDNTAPNAASVVMQTFDGSAIAGADYEAVSATFSWAVGEAGPAAIRNQEMTFVYDPTPESTETYTYNLVNAEGTTLMEPATLTVTLIDGEDPNP